MASSGGGHTTRGESGPGKAARDLGLRKVLDAEVRCGLLVVEHVNGVLVHDLGVEEDPGMESTTTHSLRSILRSQTLRTLKPRGPGIISPASLRASIVGSQSRLHRDVAFLCSMDWSLKNLMRRWSPADGSSHNRWSGSKILNVAKKVEATWADEKMIEQLVCGPGFEMNLASGLKSLRPGSSKVDSKWGSAVRGSTGSGSH